MVYGVLIHSVASSQKLFFCNFYTPEGNDDTKKIRQQTIMRLLTQSNTQPATTKSQHQKRVLEEHLFQMHFALGANHALTRSTSSSMPKRQPGVAGPQGTMGSAPGEEEWFFLTQNEAKQKANKAAALVQKDLTEGVVRLQAKPGLFDSPKIIAWKQVDQIAYTIVLEPFENPLMATTFLTLLVHEITRQFLSANKQGGTVNADAVFVDRPDQVLAILHFLLPGGQLLFMNHALYSNLRKQCQDVMKN